jgi:site-specific DNA-methyltransferase (adenine-specific)
MDLRDFEAFGEPGAIVYLGDCVDLMQVMPAASVDMIFADPPYRLSNGGVTLKNGSQAPVDKGAWDKSMGFRADHRFNVVWLKEARRILKPDGTIWVTGTHHIIFSLGFALQSMHFKLINQITWSKPNPPPNLLHTAFTHSHETLLWASRSKESRHTFNYDLVNSPDPTSQLSSVWHIPAVPMREKVHGRHPTQKPLRLLRRAVLASSAEGELVFDPFCGSGTTGVAAKELGRFFAGAEAERSFAELAGRRIGAAKRGTVLEKIRSSGVEDLLPGYQDRRRASPD